VEGGENRPGDVAAVVVNGRDGRGLVNEAGKSPVPERLMLAQAFPAVANDATSAVIQSVSVLYCLGICSVSSTTRTPP
jgi:hypothetical protein